MSFVYNFLELLYFAISVFDFQLLFETPQRCSIRRSVRSTTKSATPDNTPSALRRCASRTLRLPPLGTAYITRCGYWYLNQRTQAVCRVLSWCFIVKMVFLVILGLIVLSLLLYRTGLHRLLD